MGGGASGGSRGVDASGAEPMPGGWFTALALGGKVYGVPCNSERLLVYDPASSSGAIGVDTRRIAVGSGKWRAAAAVGGKLVGVPDRAEKLLVYDLSSGQAWGVDTTRVARGWLKWQAAVVLGGKLYGVPHHAERMLVFDPATNRVDGIDIKSIAAGPGKWSAGIAVGGKLVGVPCDAASILVYDPTCNRAHGVDINHVARGKLKWLAAVALRGRLYAVPCHASCLLVFDPLTANASGVDVSHVAAGQGKWCSAIACHGKVFGIPENAGALLVFDPATGVASGIDVESFASGPSKWQASVCLGNKIYALPLRADGILVHDAVTCETTLADTTGVETGPDKWAGAVVVGGKICGVPYFAKNILVHEPETAEEQEGSSAASNRREENIPEKLGRELLEDFVAAWLSDWIYNVEDVLHPVVVPKLRIGGHPVEFVVHKVMEEPLQGSPARLGTVTAEIPQHGKLLFLVFKGSSFLSDLIANASLSPDYAPFDRIFGDRSTFVHHGAHHAITQLRVHEWANLVEQLRHSAADGVRAVIVTGHSLGGQYALAFMLQLFLDSEERARGPGMGCEDPLLAHARCVAFGSPMAFGAAEGFDVREDLAAFMRARSVLYINGGDPAARLWSELDLEDFMRYFVSWIGEHISGIGSTLLDYAAGPGGVAKKAEELLQRPDIATHLLRPAARYVHLSRIHILREVYQPWRPLGHDGIRIEDHSIESYHAALLAAFDPALPGCLFAEGGGALIDEEGLSLVRYSQANLQLSAARHARSQRPDGSV